MAIRNVTDLAGRTWTCKAPTVTDGGGGHQGKDVVIDCETPSVIGPVRITVGWQWQTMADNGLARLISRTSPVPRR
ncbi:MAG TPA: hypothetical protein VMM18_12930 [Gemmatimonadaceae bacterium]|nr:hypothetical protein [Gemmatimonadaceae bacterium]